MVKTSKIILLIRIQRLSERELLLGIGRYFHLHGPWIIYRNPILSRKLGSREIGLSEIVPIADKLMTHMKKWGAEGILMREPDNIKKILDMKLPTIFIPVREPILGVPNVIDDNFAIGKMAAEHFLDRNFKNFAYFGYKLRYWSKQRKDGFKRTIIEANSENNFYDFPSIPGKYSWEAEQAALLDWLKSLPKPLAMMASDDVRARDVIELCKLTGFNLPDDIAIIGVGNDDVLCSLAEPPLSSVALNSRRAGYEAAELLDKMMSGKKAKNQRIIIHPTHIVTRQSTDTLAIEDSDVAGAIHIIRQNAREAISVSDVIDSVALARRALEKRFRSILGRSIHDEIQRVRAEEIIKRLQETHKSVSEISFELHYSTVAHMARFFRKAKGMSPLEYRKKYT